MQPDRWYQAQRSLASRARRAALYQRYLAGESLETLTRSEGVSRGRLLEMVRAGAAACGRTLSFRSLIPHVWVAHPTSARNNRMVALRARGWTQARIAEKYGVTAERVRQILIREAVKRAKNRPTQRKAEWSGKRPRDMPKQRTPGLG